MGQGAGEPGVYGGVEQRDVADAGKPVVAITSIPCLGHFQDIPDAVEAAKKKGKATFKPLGPKL